MPDHQSNQLHAVFRLPFRQAPQRNCRCAALHLFTVRHETQASIVHSFNQRHCCPEVCCAGRSGTICPAVGPPSTLHQLCLGEGLEGEEPPLREKENLDMRLPLGARLRPSSALSVVSAVPGRPEPAWCTPHVVSRQPSDEASPLAHETSRCLPTPIFKVHGGTKVSSR
jgi:hypothetical protein